MEVERVDIEAQQRTPDMFKKVTRPIALEFQDVVYKVKSQNPKWPFSLKNTQLPQEHIVLKGISGTAKPGEILAMLGPSGSGKTTLLTALGGRLGGNLKGTITYNSQPFSNKIKRNIGFVTQDDLLYAHLTVKETLVYTALLRLPNTLTTKQKTHQAEEVIQQLGLSRCKNSMIGGTLMRGISGGERKRVSIGQEMLINPSLLFLDEPTSGLDSTTAQRIVSTLLDLSLGGKTVVMTIHQPSSRLFYMFHKILVLSEGNSVYFGSGDRVMEYFGNVGFVPLVPMNPADFLLDLANGVSPNDSEAPGTVKDRLINEYKNKLATKVKVEIQEENQGLVQNGIGNRQVQKWATTWWQQFCILLRRGFKERKHETFDFLKVSQVLVVAFIAGLLWWHSDLRDLQDQVGLLYFSSGFWGFLPLFDALFTFPPERSILQKERSSGMYKLSSYFMARMVSDLPIQLALPTVFVFITYWMAGLEPIASSFLAYLFTLLFSVLVAQGLGLALGALVMDIKSATTLGSVIMLTFLLAGGYYVQQIPPFISWMKYWSIFNYSFKLLLGSQYTSGETYPCGAEKKMCLVEDFPIVRAVGLHGMPTAGIALLIMFVGYRVIAYLALMRIGA